MTVYIEDTLGNRSCAPYLLTPLGSASDRSNSILRSVNSTSVQHYSLKANLASHLDSHPPLKGGFKSTRSKSNSAHATNLVLVEGGGFEPPKAEPSDLQSDPFGHSGTPPKTSPQF